MRVWRLFDGDTPVKDLLSPEDAAAGCEGGYGVYEVLDGNGTILYTGRTKDLRTRLRQHARQSAFWLEAADVRWTPCRDYAEAVAAERVSIIANQCDSNIAGKVPLPDNGRQTLPQVTADRLREMYARSDQGPWDLFDFRCYIATLRHAGWTLQSLGDAIEVTREAIRQHEIRGAVDFDAVVPRPPRRDPMTGRKVWPRVRPAEQLEMRELFAQARRLRGGHPTGHPYRVASERLSQLMAELRARGVRYREIAAALGVSEEAIHQRLMRHGYRKTPPSVVPYGARKWKEAVS